MSQIFSILLFSSLFLMNIIHSERKLETTLDFDKTNWRYDEINGVNYQIGVVYSTNPVSTNYQSFEIYVPKEYLTCTQSKRKYTWEINSSGKKDSFIVPTTPFVMPVNTMDMQPWRPQLLMIIFSFQIYW